MPHARYNVRINSTGLKPGWFPELREFVDTAASHVLSNNTSGKHDAALGIHKSEIGRPTGGTNVAEISIHSESTSGT